MRGSAAAAVEYDYDYVEMLPQNQWMSFANQSFDKITMGSCDYENLESILNASECYDNRRVLQQMDSSQPEKNSKRRELCYQNNKTSLGPFGYCIDNLEVFLTTASLQQPANIPMVVTTSCKLYKRKGKGKSSNEESPVSLGIVVNALFKNCEWLYVKTPHLEEGYLLYNNCLPLCVLPASAQHRAFDILSSNQTICDKENYGVRKKVPNINRTISNVSSVYSKNSKMSASSSRDNDKSELINKTDNEKEKIYQTLKPTSQDDLIIPSKTANKVSPNSRSHSLPRFSSVSKAKHKLSFKYDLPNFTNSPSVNSPKAEGVPANKCAKSKPSQLSTVLSRPKGVFQFSENSYSAFKPVKREQVQFYTVIEDFRSMQENVLSVSKGDQVIVISKATNKWYWVKDKNSCEGYIPSHIVIPVSI